MAWGSGKDAIHDVTYYKLINTYIINKFINFTHIYLDTSIYSRENVCLPEEEGGLELENSVK